MAKDCPESVLIATSERKGVLLEKSFYAEDKVLGECIARGVGFHTAAMSPGDRELVERMFLNETLLVVCTTSTRTITIIFSHIHGCSYLQYHRESISQHTLS